MDTKMRHKIVFFFFLYVIFSVTIVYAQPQSHTYKVTFFNIRSQNNGLSEEACNAMLKTFVFAVDDNKYHFNQRDNPSYSNHKAIAFLTLKNTQFLEIDEVDTKFNFAGKNYQVVSHLSSITYTNPFMLKGILVNPYCKAAYIVLLDDPKQLESTTVKSVSPTTS